MPAPEADLVLLEQAVREAGGIARKFYRGSYRKWDKGNGQPVTDCDLAVDHFLSQHLRSARPSYGWLSEETADDPARQNAETVFIVDPIDGTVAFLKGRPHFTICAATVTAGVPAAGAVYNPVTGECFTASAGNGAKLNGKPIHVSTREMLEGCRILGPKTTLIDPPPTLAPSVPWPHMQVETRNSVAYRLVLVACGAFDATVALSSKSDWDLAAADVIVKESGGCITTHTGATLGYNRASPKHPSVVAAGPALQQQLIARVENIRLPGQ